ncbi:DUF1697 domain-containing protein [bacterium]|nr:DUF1697 domain-containing protein [bacterium]
MPKQVAVLRGINVAGRNTIKMVELRKLLADAGFKNVSTYIQSGNILFENRRSGTANATAIRKLIADEYGYDVPTLVVAASTLTKIATGSPFSSDHFQHLHVTLLDSKPKTALVKAIAGLEFGDDEFKIVGDVVYVYCPNGYGRTKLNNQFFESKLKTQATTRNWKTLNKLIELADAS